MRVKKIAFVENDCVACGNCAKYCKLGAIAVQNGLYAVVDENKCVGCGKCAMACPADVIRLADRERVSA